MIARIRASLKLAESSVIEALGVTGAARRTTSDVQDDIKNLQGTLQQSREVVAALKNLNHTYQDIATNPKFQEGVTAKVIADIRMQIPNIISQSFEFVVRTSGLVL